MNPYVAIGSVVLLAGGGFATGWKVNSWRHDSQQLAIEQAAAQAGQAATDAAVKAIKDIRVQRVTIRQELEREIRLQPVGGDCDLSDGLFNTLNQAITGKVGGGAGVPGTDPAAGQDPDDADP